MANEVKIILTAENKVAPATAEAARAFETLKTKTVAEINQQKQAAEQAYKAIKTSGIDSAEEIKQAWVGKNKVITDIDNKLLAGQLSLFEKIKANYLGIGTILTAVIGIGYKAIQSVANHGEEMLKMSQQTGIAVDKLSGLAYAAQQSESSIDALITGSKEFSKAIHGMNEEGKDTTKLLSAIGVSAKDPYEALLQVADAFSGMEDGTGKSTLAIKLFGRSALDLIPLLNQGSAGIRELHDEAERAGVVIDQDMAKAADAFNDNITRMKANLMGMVQTIGNAVIPKLNELFGKLSASDKIFLEYERLDKQIKSTQNVQGWLKEHGLSVLVSKDNTALAGLIKKRAEIMDEIWDLSVPKDSGGKKPAPHLPTKAEEEAAKKIAQIKQEYESLVVTLNRKLAMTGLDDIDKKLMQITYDFVDMKKEIGAKDAQIYVDLQLQIINKEEFDKSLKAIKGAYESLESEYIPSEEARQKAIEEHQDLLTEIAIMRGTVNEKELLALDARYYEEGVKLKNNLDAQKALMEKYGIERKAILDRQGRDTFASYIQSIGDLVPAFDEATYVTAKFGETNEEYLKRVVDKQKEWLPLLEAAQQQLVDEGLAGTKAYNDIAAAIQGVKNNQAELNKTFGGGVQQGIDDYLKGLEFSFERGREIALDNIHAIDDAMMTMLDDPKEGMDDLFEYFKFTLKRMVVEALATKITIPLATMMTGSQAGIQGALGGITSGGGLLGGLGSLFAGGGIGIPALASLGLGSMYGGTTGTGAMLGGLAGSVLLTGAGTAGYGLIGGSLMSGLMGGGSGILGGALAGSIVPIIGTAIGALVGGLAGSLFGGEEDPHDLQLRFGGERGSTWQSKFGQTDWGIRQWDEIGDDNVRAILGIFDKLHDGLTDFFTETGRDLGILAEEWKSGKIELKKGMKMEDVVKQLVGQYTEFVMPDVDFKQFQKSGEELYETIIRVVDAFSAIDDIKESVDDFIGAVQGAPDTVAMLRDSIINAKADLKELKDSIDEMVDPADRIAALNDLKVATYEFAQEQIQAIKAAQDTISNLKIEKTDFALSMAEKISGLLGTAMADISIPSDAMDTAKRRMEESGTAAGKLDYLKQYVGYLDKWVDQNLTAIERKYATEKELLEDHVAVIQKWKSVQQSVSSQITGMKLSTDNPQDVLARLGIAKGEVDRLGGLYAGATGEEKAGLASDYQQSINDYLALAQEAYQRPSSAYRAIYDKALGLLGQIQSDAAAMGTDDTALLQEISAIDDAMAADIKSFKESAAEYYQWAQAQSSLYDEAIADYMAQLVAITGDKTPEEKIAELQQDAVTELEGIKTALDQIHLDFTAWQQTPGADIADIKDILALGSNPFQKGTTESGWWKEYHDTDVSAEQAQMFLNDILDDVINPFLKKKKAWYNWFDQFADVPEFADGGYVPRDTYAKLHAGEKVLTKQEVEAGSGTVVNVAPQITIYASGDASPKEIGQEVERIVVDSIKYGKARAAVQEVVRYG
jgi:hypothetical protein